MLKERGIIIDGAGDLTLDKAIDVHRKTTDKELCRALRVVLASNMVPGPSADDKKYQAKDFHVRLCGYAGTLGLGQQDYEALTSIFKKAACHRIHDGPWKR